VDHVRCVRSEHPWTHEFEKDDELMVALCVGVDVWLRPCEVIRYLHVESSDFGFTEILSNPSDLPDTQEELSDWLGVMPRWAA